MWTALLPAADRSRERLVGPAVAERDDLVEQRRRPQMRIAGQPQPAVLRVLLERVDHRLGRRPGVASPYRYRRTVTLVTSKWRGDRTDRPR
jgi:hypothetical protein